VFVSQQSLATRVRRTAGLDEFSSPFAFADRMRIRLTPDASVPHGAQLVGREIRWDATPSQRNQRTAVGREFCRWVLRVRGADPTDANIASLFAAMFPYDALPACLKQPHLRVLNRPLQAQQPDVATRRERLHPPPARAVQRR
jgi:hypothetical protein